VLSIVKELDRSLYSPTFHKYTLSGQVVKYYFRPGGLPGEGLTAGGIGLGAIGGLTTGGGTGLG